jgi:four helix bundle protein
MAFRFQTLEVYQLTLEISGDIFMLLDDLQNKRKFVLSDQFFRAYLSITNNIAEGSGSNSNKEFGYFLNIARRSVFECVNMLIILERKKLITNEKKDILTEQFDIISRKLFSLRNTLLKQ